MKIWKCLGAALLSFGPLALAENINTLDKALITTTLAPTVIIGGTLASTSDAPKVFESAKSDALAFIGSDGEIRGARFEQAARHYHATYHRPWMTDRQLAVAIAATE